MTKIWTSVAYPMLRLETTSGRFPLNFLHIFDLSLPFCQHLLMHFMFCYLLSTPDGGRALENTLLCTRVVQAV